MPKPGKDNYDQPKPFRPICLQSCLAKCTEKIVATRLTNAASLTGAISAEHFGCLPQRAADDALQTLLSPAQAWLRTTGAYTRGVGWQQPVRPAILTNDIDGAFNCVIYRRLTELMRLMKLPSYLIN